MQRYAGIFGTPPEPLFNVKPEGMSGDLLQQWLDALIKQNEDRLMKPVRLHSQTFFKADEAAEYVFNMCEKLKQPPEAKYFAVEIFNKFMVQHVYDLYEHIRKSGSSDRQRDWLATMDRVKNQVVLRVVTCCQVASKLTSHYKVVTPRKAFRVLQEFGHRYNPENILHSELRVIKTLNYRLMITTPLVYIEAMLESLARRKENVEIKVCHDMSMALLDLVYMQRTEVYDQLFAVTLSDGEDKERDREKFYRVESDYVLLSASCIAAATFITDQSEIDQIIEEVAEIGKLNSSDVVDFATVIVQITLRQTEQ